MDDDRMTLFPAIIDQHFQQKYEEITQGVFFKETAKDSIEYNETLETSSSFSRSEKHEDLNTSETRIEDRIRKPIHCIPVGGTEVFFRGKGWRRRREKHKEGIWWRMFKLSCEQENMVPISSFPENEKARRFQNLGFGLKTENVTGISETSGTGSFSNQKFTSQITSTLHSPEGEGKEKVEDTGPVSAKRKEAGLKDNSRKKVSHLIINRGRRWPGIFPGL